MVTVRGTKFGYVVFLTLMERRHTFKLRHLCHGCAVTGKASSVGQVKSNSESTFEFSAGPGDSRGK